MTGRGDAPAPTVRRRIAVGAAVAAAIAALGIPLGLLWWLVAPRPDVTVVTGGDTMPYPVSESMFAMDGSYALIMMVTGIATGYCAYLVQYRLAVRDHTDLRLTCLFATAGGALAGSVIAWRLGVLLDAAEFGRALDQAAPGDLIRSGLRLEALSALVVWPFVAVLQYGLFDGVSLWRRDLPVQRAELDAEAFPADHPGAAATGPEEPSGPGTPADGPTRDPSR
ncbi:hypothetical protein ACFOVU_21945 [Nocardiopsis sediminis]|uniref:DUF2567 domain-containing protein n=1 Tax=Nocardiopsis sediminis TaxID=1778267 RepID=A0ABV8FTN2_9ACTN